MRRFIYLDTDVLNSYLAQIDDGLLDSQEIESQTGGSTVKQKQHTVNAGAEADLKLLGKGLESKIEYIFERMKSSEQSEIYKDVKTKKLHDNAFDKFTAYLESSDELNSATYREGSFVKFNGLLSFIDFEYLLAQFEDNGIVKYTKESQEKALKMKIDEELKTIPRDQKRAKDSEINKIIKDQMAEFNATYDNILENIKMIKSVIPYKNIIISDKFILATSESYFRDNPEIIAFKYGGSLSIVGYVTNVVYGKDEISDDTNVSPLASIQPMVNQLLTKLFNAEKTMYIVHPIAIYYE